MIANAWTVFWSVAPFAASPIAIVMFGRYVVRKSSAEGFAAEFVSKRYLPLTGALLCEVCDGPALPIALANGGGLR